MGGDPMRDYLPKTYSLPKAVYYQALYAVRDYDRLRAEYDDILHASAAPPDGLPHGSGSGQPVMDKAIRLNAISAKLTAIERALSCIPPEYRRGVLDNVRYQAPYPYVACYRTWSTYRRRFLFGVAKNLRLL